MKITTNRGEKVRFNDIRPGEVFQDQYRETYIKTSEGVVTLASGTTSKVNALFLETGNMAVFEERDAVYKVDAELVIL